MTKSRNIPEILIINIFFFWILFKNPFTSNSFKYGIYHYAYAIFLLLGRLILLIIEISTLPKLKYEFNIIDIGAGVLLREEFVEIIFFIFRHPYRYISQPFQRINLVKLTRAEKRVEHCCPLAAFMSSMKQEVTLTDCRYPDSTLYMIIQTSG